MEQYIFEPGDWKIILAIGVGSVVFATVVGFVIIQFLFWAWSVL